MCVHVGHAREGASRAPVFWPRADDDLLDLDLGWPRHGCFLLAAVPLLRLAWPGLLLGQPQPRAPAGEGGGGPLRVAFCVLATLTRASLVRAAHVEQARVRLHVGMYARL